MPIKKWLLSLSHEWMLLRWKFECNNSVICPCVTSLVFVLILCRYVIVTPDPTVFTCVNGNIRENEGRMLWCDCLTLWEDSGLVDMNGISFKCDKVVEDLKRYFYESIEVDKKGEVIKYGSYTPQQLDIMLKELKKMEEEQTMEYIYNQSAPILYAVDKFLESESLIRVY